MNDDEIAEKTPPIPDDWQSLPKFKVFRSGEGFWCKRCGQFEQDHGMLLDDDGARWAICSDGKLASGDWWPPDNPAVMDAIQRVFALEAVGKTIEVEG